MRTVVWVVTFRELIEELSSRVVIDTMIGFCRDACAVSAQIAFGNQTDITGCGDFGLMGGRVFDVVAIPAETPFIQFAQQQGKQTISGAEVIALQAVEQFELYTGIRPDDQLVAEAAAFARKNS